MPTPAAIPICPEPASPELANAALSSGPLTRALKLAGWVGTGRALTLTGVLRPAEAAQACSDLGIELAGPRLRSALDVDELMRDWDTALLAGFLLTEGRRAWAAPDLPDAGSSAHSDPEAILGAWMRAAMFFLNLDEDLCAGCLAIVHALYAADGPLTPGQLANALRDPEPQESDLRELLGDEEWVQEDAAGHVADVVFTLVEFAAATLDDEAVRLTRLGIFLAESALEDYALAPDESAEIVVSAITEVPLALARTIASSWLSVRSASDALQELLAFAEFAGGAERIAALSFASELGPEAADVWREWAKRPGFGAYARDWLRSRGELETVDPADEAWLVVDAMCIMVDSLDEGAPLHLLRSVVEERVCADDADADAAETMLRSGHPRAQEVVATLGDRPVLEAVSGSPSAQPAQLYQLKITLRGVSKPPVWRRVLVPASITLSDLHGVIQQAMGWYDDHLHSFSAGWQEFGSPDPGLGRISDKKVCLSQVVNGPGDRFRYTYDFGDDWEHDVVVEESLVAEAGQTYPACVDGKGACPPEDCGGASGYAWLKEVLARPSHKEHEDMLEWLGLDAGDDFDPKEFSAADVNSRLRPAHG